MPSDIITFSSFSKFPQLIHGISTRTFGSIKQKDTVYHENLERFVTGLASPLQDVVFTRQVHGSNVIDVSNVPEELLEGADGLMTDNAGFFIGMVTADCLPILFFDKKQQRIAVIHAGYQGILKGIIEETSMIFREKGSDPKDILVGIGPGIGVCCYTVPQERIAAFENRYSFDAMFTKRDGEYYLDLKNIARSILEQDGIQSSSIEISPFCTQSRNDLFFSFRGDSKETFGEFATIIGIIPNT